MNRSNTKTMRTGLAGIALLGSFLVTATAMAVPTDYTGLVSVLRVDADGRGIVYFDAPAATGTPGAGCRHAEMKTALSFNTATPGGEAILRTLTAAHLAGRKVRFFGKEACTLYNNVVEEAAAVYVQP